MALYMTIDNEYELQKIFADWDRDYYSPDGYKAILDYYNETDSELDVIAICCSFTEYNIDELLCDYEETDFESWLNDNGFIENWLYDNDFDDVDSGIPEPKHRKLITNTKEDDTNHDKNTIERIRMEGITAQRNRRK